MNSLARTYIERDLLFEWLTDTLVNSGQETRREVKNELQRKLNEVINELD